MAVFSRQKKVILLQMPFAVTAWPSLGLSLLKSLLEDLGCEASVVYVNQSFSDRIGKERYAKLANGAPQNVDLAGEWVFSSALWGADSASDEAYFDEVLLGGDRTHAKPVTERTLLDMKAVLSDVARETLPFLDGWVDAVDWESVGIVGFTSTFQQHVPSLALAKLLKRRHPHLHIVFGGANCEDGMGRATLRNFEFVDAVCLGEGDTAFPAYVEALASGDTANVAGMLTRDMSPASIRAAKACDLDALPYPDFDDFFAGAPSDSDDYAKVHRLIFESSRGCWWGQKNHCTFCGLNGGTMGFRQKTGERAVQELQHLVRRYGRHTHHVTATDNIMPYNYFATFLPKIAALGLDLNLFYETKANLKKDHIRSYKSAGLTSIQPGIESLSTDILKLMRKGITSLQNVQLLKWCREMGIVPKWNFLAGFPGEDARSYETVGPMVRKLTHLTPPVGVSTLRFDRFSPYTSHPEDFGITSLRPYPAYFHVYRGLPPEEVCELAYYFVGAFDGDKDVAAYTETAFAELDRWKSYADASALFHIRSDDSTLVFDAREDDARIFRLSGSFHRLFAHCDGITTRDALAREEGSASIDTTLDDLESYGLFLRENDQFINVSIPLEEEYCPPPDALRKFDRFYAATDEHATDGGDAIVISELDLIRLDAEPFAPTLMEVCDVHREAR